MNQLKMDIQQTISTLSRGDWSQRRIARELGIDRETAARYRRLARQVAKPKPAIPPIGSELVEGTKKITWGQPITWFADLLLGVDDRGQRAPGIVSCRASCG